MKVNSRLYPKIQLIQKLIASVSVQIKLNIVLNAAENLCQTEQIMDSIGVYMQLGVQNKDF